MRAGPASEVCCRHGVFVDCHLLCRTLTQARVCEPMVQTRAPPACLSTSGFQIDCACPPNCHLLLRRDVEWEGEDVWFAHCCFLDSAEVKQLAEKGMGVAHCPSSNLRLASGELQGALHCFGNHSEPECQSTGVCIWVHRLMATSA